MNSNMLQHQPRSAAVANDSLPRTLVTGATSGIGRELALQLAHAGVPVLALGRSAHGLQLLKAECPQIETIVCDLTNIRELTSMTALWVSDFPDLACIIHNAGIQDNVRVDDANYDAIKLDIEVRINLVAPMVITQALLPHLKTKSNARVVNVTSGLAFVPKRTAAVYSATKAGLHLFSDGLRVQLHGSTVKVVEAVMPLVDTAMTRGRGNGKISPAVAAREIIKGIHSDKPVLWIGKARLVPLLLRLAPGLLARILQRS